MTSYLLYIAVLICLLISGALAAYSRDGWGWFLFAAIVIANAAVEASR